MEESGYDNNYGNYGGYGYGYRRKNSFATASLVLGIISIICVITVQFIYFSIAFGCLGILFALLSKGGGYRMEGKAVGGLTVSLFAVVITITILAIAVWFAISVFGLETFLDPDALTEALEAFYEQYSELLESATGGVAL